MAWGKGEVTGTMVLTPKPPGRDTAGYSGLNYTPFLIDEKKENGKYQQIAIAGKWQIKIEGDNWVDGTTTSYVRVDPGGGSATKNIQARYVIYYKVGEYYYKTSTATRLDGWSSTIPSAYWDPADGATNKEVASKTFYSFSSRDSRDVPDEEGAYKDEEGNWVKDETTTNTESASPDEEGAYESPPGSGNWVKDVESTITVPSSGYTEYDIVCTMTTYVLTLKINNEAEEEISQIFAIPFYPSPVNFYFKLNYTDGEVRLYVDIGLISAISNYNFYQSYASQWKAWKYQEASKCPAWSGNPYINAANLNEIHSFAETGNSYSKDQKIELDMFTSLEKING